MKATNQPTETNQPKKKSTPPAGTKTHKLACGCPQCKAKRYDALVVMSDQIRKERDKALGEMNLWAEKKAILDLSVEKLAQVIKPEDTDHPLWGLAWIAAYLDQVALKITALETSNNWSAAEIERIKTDAAKIAQAKENLWSDYQDLQKKHDALEAQVNLAGIRTKALVSLFSTFDKDKPAVPESQLVTAVNTLFLERDNARRAWERAQNNVNRLKNEEDRLTAILGRTFEAMKEVGLEIEEYSDMPEAIEVMGVAAVDAEKEIAGPGKAAGWWRGAAGWLGMLVLAVVVASLWRLTGSTK